LPEIWLFSRNFSHLAYFAGFCVAISRKWEKFA